MFSLITLVLITKMLHLHGLHLKLVENYSDLMVLKLLEKLKIKKLKNMAMVFLTLMIPTT